jgi:hypothetical protein
VSGVQNEIVVRGNLQEIIGKLNHVMRVVKIREATGWPLLMADENWKYITMGDERVCPICAALEGVNFNGPGIPDKFPFHEFLEETVIIPHIHPNCRCHLEWPDSAAVLERRLHEEKQLSAGIPPYGKVAVG